MSKRPYFRSSIDELEDIFEENKGDRKFLLLLQKELTYRKRPRAKALAKKIKVILDAPVQLELPILATRTNKPYKNLEIKDRPYFNCSLYFLDRLFKSNPYNRKLSIQIYNELSYRQGVRVDELSKKIKIILSRNVGAYSPHNYTYDNIAWFENLVELFQDNKIQLQKIINILLNKNLDERTYRLISKIRNILCQKHGILISYNFSIENRLLRAEKKFNNKPMQNGLETSIIGNRKRPGLICAIVLFLILGGIGAIIDHIYRWPAEVGAFVGGFGSIAYFMCMERIEVFFDRFFDK